MLESLIVYVLLFLCTFAVVEVARLIAFKNSMQAITSYIAHKIAYSQIDLTKKNILYETMSNVPNRNNIQNKNYLTSKISREISSYLNGIKISLISFDHNNDFKKSTDVLSIENRAVRVDLKADRKGFYLESQTCLPVLFSLYFRSLHKKVHVGEKKGGSGKDCLGRFNSSSNLPIYWFTVRVAAFSPWPASTEIFNRGLAQPKKFESLEALNREHVLNTISSHNLTQYFNTEKNKNIKGWFDEKK